MALTDWFGVTTTLIGMVHLDPLPGAPQATDGLETVCKAARRDAERLAAGGVDGLMIENYGDSPFYPESVPKHTVAVMTRIGTAIADAVDCPLGINVLRNDAEAALSVAAVLGPTTFGSTFTRGLQSLTRGSLKTVPTKRYDFERSSVPTPSYWPTSMSNTQLNSLLAGRLAIGSLTSSSEGWRMA